MFQHQAKFALLQEVLGEEFGRFFSRITLTKFPLLLTAVLVTGLLFQTPQVACPFMIKGYFYKPLLRVSLLLAAF